ncbi:Lsr2 family protein [Rhodococcus opacus]|uniref:Histone-like nucleoid-structuring protein Lsr2 n=1 Tax=Rhodococcus opacus TaxID=37919 RepID=A0AAX3YMS5_RHOOP|nr:histone-like nucleoid-structuring protein Lsr2 [Rhodococcus opacus]MCZ4588523.1 Lsr2 family protein [Rhodococcus opacus]WLF50548.1 histone-like nucleoid-structuring protein Lsr2 [Rhodococcus opacus]
MAVSPRGSEGSARKTTREIREWAIGEGREVSSRGRISAELEQAFHDAQAKKVQTKTPPVKKTAVKKRVAPKAPVTRTAVNKAPAKKSSREIREWAIGEGREVSSRGRISAELEQAFHDAQAKKVQTKTPPVKKTAVKKRVAPKAPVTRTAVNKAPAKKSSREIREWAIGEGREVSSRGRIPAELKQAFHDAQAKKVQTKSAPVKKTVAKKTVAKKTVATKAAAEKTVVKKRVAPKAPVTRTAVNKAPAKKSSREIREWAIGAGHEVSSRGRIPAELEQAFHDAQAKKVQAKTAPEKKAAVKKIVAKNAPARKTAVKKAAVTKVPAKTTTPGKTPARRVAAKTTAAEKTAVKMASAKKSSREIREWAIGEGREVSPRGRISAEIEQAFRDAQAQMPVAVG